MAIADQLFFLYLITFRPFYEVSILAPLKNITWTYQKFLELRACPVCLK